MSRRQERSVLKGVISGKAHHIVSALLFCLFLPGCGTDGVGKDHESTDAVETIKVIKSEPFNGPMVRPVDSRKHPGVFCSCPACGGSGKWSAVRMGLQWLENHQDPEGYWDADNYNARCADKRCSGRGHALNDVGVTGLALNAFLDSGSTVAAGPYKKAVKKGVKYLCDVQDPGDGCLVPKEGVHWMYNHAIAALALVKAYGLSQWSPLKKRAQMAVDFVHGSKNPGKAWRYNSGELDPVDQNDMSVTGWMVLCLVHADRFGFEIDKQDLRDALKYMDELTDPATGRTGYKTRGSYSAREAGDETVWPFDETEAMTALAIYCRILAGSVLCDLESQEAIVQAGAKLLLARVPEWDEEKGCIDFYYWYYGTRAMSLLEGEYWKTWISAADRAVIGNQERDGCEKGSWDPHKDPWGDNGGRVYSTALMTLCLDTHFLHKRKF